MYMCWHKPETDGWCGPAELQLNPHPWIWVGDSVHLSYSDQPRNAGLSYYLQNLQSRNSSQVHPDRRKWLIFGNSVQRNGQNWTKWTLKGAFLLQARPIGRAAGKDSPVHQGREEVSMAPEYLIACQRVYLSECSCPWRLLQTAVVILSDVCYTPVKGSVFYKRCVCFFLMKNCTRCTLGCVPGCVSEQTFTSTKCLWVVFETWSVALKRPTLELSLFNTWLECTNWAPSPRVAESEGAVLEVSVPSWVLSAGGLGLNDKWYLRVDGLDTYVMTASIFGLP